MLIDFDLEFPHLNAAPIVEAAIHWQARATRSWQPDDLQATLAKRLPEYPKVEAQHTLEFAFIARIDNTAETRATNHEKTWQGLRLTSATNKGVAQFTRDGLIFSRLEPYEDWERFTTEARRLWAIFVELGSPSDVQRLGVRFINRIQAARCENLAQFLKDPPSLTTDFPLSGFLYQSTLDVPGHDLSIRIVKTMPNAISRRVNEAGLIVDIDVFTTRAMLCDDVEITGYLSKMHWLKNKVFFDLLTPQAIDSMK